MAGGLALSTVRPALAVALVHRYVPPTPVTSGSDAGHCTVGNGISDPPACTGVFSMLAVPLSPDDPSTVTPFCAAETNAWRRFCNDCALPNASSAEANDCEITLAR